jgi:peptide/nickel transport system permease protein
MSSVPVQEKEAKDASPAENDLPDLYLLLSPGSGAVFGKTAFWLGIVLGLWFILGAYQTHEDVSASVALAAGWHDWVWIGLAGIGMLVSFAVCSRTMSLRKPGDLPYDVLAALGGALSAVVMLIMILEYAASAGISSWSGGDVLWPDARPLWFLPLSSLGVTLPMVALILARGGDMRDEILGLFLSCGPLIVLSLPLLLGMDADGIIRWIPTIYLVAGLSVMMAGLRPFSRAEDITLESMERLASRVLAAMLVCTGVVGWRLVPADGELSSSMDAVWFIPLVVNLIVSVAFFKAIRGGRSASTSLGRDQAEPSTNRGTRASLSLAMSLIVIASSLVLLSLFILGYLDALNFSEGDLLYALTLPRNMWLYPLSLVGTALIMLSANLMDANSTENDRLVGLLYATLPAVVVSSLAAGWQVLSKAELTHPLLSGANGALLYIGFAVAVLVSGMEVETFIKSQLPVVREKSALNRKKYAQIVRQVSRNLMGVIGLSILVVFVVMAIIGPYVAPYEVDMTVNGQFDRYMPESSEHLMGTDVFGHDIFSQLLYGAKTSITVGVVAAFISSFLGAAIGLYSGYAGGWKDEAIMRLNDIALSIPWLVLMIIIAAFMGSIDLVGIILVIGLTGWSGTARLVRAQVLSLRERQYIERARAIGSDDMHIITKHILPNAFPLVFANTILTVAGSILAEATLSFLGLEPQGVVTWGTMLSDAQEAGAFTIGLHWWIVAPGICIVLVVLGFTLMGYALDDVMNPRLRKR